MADLRSSFTILEDSATQAGLPLHKALEGEAVASKNAHGAFVAKDPSNQFAYLEKNAQGELKVSNQGDEAYLSAKGSAVGSATFVDIATITLAVSKTYRNIGWIIGCLRDAEFKIVQVNDMTTTDIALGLIAGAGDYTDSGELRGLSVTSGASGTQTLKIQAKNFNALSDMRATLSVIEQQ